MAETRFGEGIALNCGFDLGAKQLLDNRSVVASKDALEAIPNYQRASGLLVWVEGEKRLYAWDEAGKAFVKVCGCDGLEEAIGALSADVANAQKSVTEMSDTIDSHTSQISDLELVVQKSSKIVLTNNRGVTMAISVKDNVQTPDLVIGCYSIALNTSSVTIGGTCTAAKFITSSDARLKDVDEERPDYSVEDITSIPILFYRLKADEADAPRQIGVLAQDVREKFPEMVDEVGDGYLGVDYSRFGLLAIQAAKKLHERMVALEKRVAELEGANADK